MQQSADEKFAQETARQQDLLIEAACKSYPVAPLPGGFTSRVMQQLPWQLPQQLPRQLSQQLPTLQGQPTVDIRWRLQAADIVLICFFTIFVLTLPLVLFWMTQLPATGWQGAESDWATIAVTQLWAAWPIWTVIAATFGGLLICASFVALNLPSQFKITASPFSGKS